MEKLPLFILRKSDFTLLKLQENNKYKFIPVSSIGQEYTLESLRDVYTGMFSPIYNKEEINIIEDIRKRYYNSFIIATHKNDGHGGSYSEFSGNFLDWIKEKGNEYIPNEFAWSEEKLFSKNDVLKIKQTLLQKTETIFNKVSVVEINEINIVFDEFLKK